MKTLLVLLLLPGLVGAADFDSYWHDGKAELDGYRLTVSRYGQERKGQAVAVYVTEPFDEGKRVKADSAGPGTVDVLKLNLVRDFQTGIYDYNTMVSTFVRTRDLSPVKTSFSSAEWCGHVFEELLFFPGKITGFYNSYFEGESGAIKLDWPAGGVTEDNLWILLRGLRGEFLKPGESKTVPYLPGSFHSRLAHKPLAWSQADIARDSNEPNLYTIRIRDGRTGKFWIESEYPHRIRRWELLPDISAELTGTLRVPYWQLHGNGDEQLLQKLGIRPTVE